MPPTITAATAAYCFLDLDINHHRSKLATAAAFVQACDTRYGFSSGDLRNLGGSEVKRIPELLASDHEWSGKEIVCKPTREGNRVVVRLFWDVAPLACENFATLCANGAHGSSKAPIGDSGKPLTYRNSMVHRLVPDFVVQAGDFVFGNGSGGESIYGKKFKDERAGLQLKHDRAGVLSMGNSGKNANTSQFFFTLKATPQCDGKHVVFGEVVSGWSVIEALAKHGTSGGDPTVPIEITDCGVWTPFETPGAGYWYDQPDPESYSGISPAFLVRPRVAVLVPSEAVLDKFQKILEDLCPVQAVIDSETAVSEIRNLLDRCVVDVVLYAPACRDHAQEITLPDSWSVHGRAIGRDEVVLEAKPIEAPSVLLSSWVASHPTWQQASPKQ